MKILIFSPFALENGRGGEISAIELAAGLKNYYNVLLVDSNRIIGKKLLTEEVIRKKLKGLEKIGRIKYLTLNIFNRNFSIPRPGQILKLFKEVKKSNIAYTSLLNVTNIFLFILFSLLHRKGKFIIGFRKPLSSNKIFSLYNIKYRFSILLLTIFRKRFFIHTISSHAKIYLEKFYCSNRVKHIIHGVVLEGYKQDEINEKSQDILNLIYVGYLDEVHKGLDVLINAISNLLEEKEELPIFFEFCGAGPSEHNVRELEKKFPKSVKFHGYIDNDVIVKLYKKNDIFLFTSRREPFGRVLIEAMAAGLLVICSKTIGSIEILKGKDFAFFIQELTVKGITDRIKEVYELWVMQKNKFRALQESSKLYALQSFSFTLELEMFKNFIDDLKVK